MATKKKTPTYRALQSFGDFAEGQELAAKDLGDDLEWRIADGFVAPVDDAPAETTPAEPTATTVVGKNGTITATVQ